MNFIEKFLVFVASAQKKYGSFIIAAALIFTIFMAYGATKIRMESDFNKEMPQQLPIYQITNKVRDTFSGLDTIFILLVIDDTLESKGAPNDIRDPEVMDYLISLEDSLAYESSIDGVISLGTVIAPVKDAYGVLTPEIVNSVIENNPELSQLVSSDYKKTIVIVNANVGTGEDKVLALTDLMESKIKALSTPPGVKVMITGTPSIRVVILNLLKHDSIYTLILASLIILVLLFIMQRSVSKALLIFTPLILGLIWTLGTMGWLNIKISIVTAGLGAMILGLGVEYGVFILTRYHEERDNGKNQEQSLSISVPSVGSAILGSGTTTIVGFLALTLSIMPMLQKLGFSLALGIFYCILSSVFVEPVLIIYEEDLEYWYTHRKHSRLEIKKKAHQVRQR